MNNSLIEKLKQFTNPTLQAPEEIYKIIDLIDGSEKFHPGDYKIMSITTINSRNIFLIECYSSGDFEIVTVPMSVVHADNWEKEAKKYKIQKDIHDVERLKNSLAEQLNVMQKRMLGCDTRIFNYQLELKDLE